MGFFDKMFDLNRDGKLDMAEKALQFDFISREICSNSDSNYEYDKDDELELAGLERDELECMDEDERREALEDAGLDPDDFDF